MHLQISRLGRTLEVDVSAADLLSFPQGLIGFEDQTQLALLPDPDGGLSWLHPTDGDATLAFPVLDPFLVWPDYDVTLQDAEIESLGLERAEDALLLAIVTPREDPGEITANLRAPIVINRRTRVGRQIILPHATYAIRTPILPALVAEIDADTETERSAAARAAAATRIDRAAA